MAQYATALQFGEFGLPPAALDGFTGSVDDHLTMASGVFDSYARGRYAVPLAGPTYPTEVIAAVCAIAAYTIMMARGFDPSSGADQNVRERYQDMLGRPGQKGWLQQLAGGMVNLDLASDATSGVHDGAPIVRGRFGSSGRYGAGSCGQYRDSCCDTRGGRYDFWGLGRC
jgi:phage gp36-like protein